MKTPFEEYKGTELSIDTLENYFVEPKYISKMQDNSVAFVIGQRGTGKTTLLKHLCSVYNSKSSNKLGIYYRFDVNKMRSFSGSALEREEWEDLFAHSFSIEICLKLTELMISMRKIRPIKNESIICNRIKKLFFEDIDIDTSNFEGLQKYLEEIDLLAKRYKRNPRRASQPLISECEKTFEEFCRLISAEDAYKGTSVHFLFDEYENMLDYQKEFVNSCIKNATSYYTYKICVRPYGMNDMKTRKSTEILNEADDYKIINYIDDIIGGEDDVAEFMRNACARRLMAYYSEQETPFTNADLNIDNYFPVECSYDELYDRLSNNVEYVNSNKNKVEKIFKQYNLKYDFSWGLMQLKLFIALSQKRNFNIYSVVESINSKDKKYKGWVNNYKNSILYMCFSELNLPYEMSGFKDIIKISGNVVRYVLEICDYSFLCTSLASDGKFSPVSAKMQTEAIGKVSKRRFQQISTIPNYGQEIKQMTLAIGMIFNMYHRDEQIKRFEPNHFSIERKSDNNYYKSNVKSAMDLSVTYGVFESERSTKNRSGSDVPIENEDFHLHPILTPYFNISWRKKQKCRFTLNEMEGFLFGSDERVSELLNKYSAKTKQSIYGTKDSQISFEALRKEYF